MVKLSWVFILAHLQPGYWCCERRAEEVAEGEPRTAHGSQHPEQGRLNNYFCLLQNIFLVKIHIRALNVPCCMLHCPIPTLHCCFRFQSGKKGEEDHGSGGRGSHDSRFSFARARNALPSFPPPVRISQRAREDQDWPGLHQAIVQGALLQSTARSELWVWQLVPSLLLLAQPKHTRPSQAQHQLPFCD